MLLDFIKKKWPLFLIIIVFIYFKFSHLHSSFYWDESWPYASGVYAMYQNGPSIFPGSINGELARGHPLLFHFLGAIWMKIFGQSIFSLHCYALCISVLFLIFIFEAAFRLLDIKAAVLALLLIAFQQIYFVQSAFVLLEILLAFMVMASIYFYVTKNYVLTAFALTLLFYTKESGLVLGLVLGIDAIVQIFKKGKTFSEKWKPIVSLLFPFLMICLFFLMQKRMSGWYVLPLYSNGFEQSWLGFYDKFRASVKVVFRDDYRRYFFVLFALMNFSFAAFKKDYKLLLAIIVSSLVVFLLCSDQYHGIIGGVLSVFLFFFSVLWVIIELNKTFFNQNILVQRMTLLSVVFGVCFFVFTAYNLFFIDRYLLSALIPFLFVSAVYSSQIIISFDSRFFIPLLIFVSVNQYYSIQHPKHLGDHEMGAFDGIYVHEQVVNFLFKNNFKESKVSTGAYLEQVHLTDSNARYLNGSEIFTSVKWAINEGTEIVIFDNIEPDERYKDFLMDRNFKLIYKVSKGKAWAEVYRRKYLK